MNREKKKKKESFQKNRQNRKMTKRNQLRMSQNWKRAQRAQTRMKNPTQENPTQSNSPPRYSIIHPIIIYYFLSFLAFFPFLCIPIHKILIFSKIQEEIENTEAAPAEEEEEEEDFDPNE